MLSTLTRAWSAHFHHPDEIAAFADEHGFGEPSTVGERVFRRNTTGQVLHHSLDLTLGSLIVVIEPASAIEGIDDAMGIRFEQPVERMRRDIAVAYGHTTATMALLKIDMGLEQDVAATELSRRGKASGMLDMAGLHLAQNLSRPERDRIRDSSQKVGDTMRPSLTGRESA